MLESINMINNVSQIINDTNMFQAVISGIFVLLGAFIAMLSGIVLVYLTNKLEIKKEIQLKNYEKRQIVYSELMGMRLTMSQLYLSRFEALVYSDYHEFRYKITKDNIDLSESIRWMHKSEDFVKDIAQHNQKLFEKLGLTKILFPNSSELDKLIEDLINFKTPIILQNPTDEMNISQLEEWKVKAIKDLQKIVEEEYKRPIDNLLRHLYKFTI